ncbi:MAG: hypothetical protein FJ128_04870 [Deltaproteobacteria bacterium]|nr:hypothetical protein [Deltaproteobacteria bacterium]
MKLREIGIEGIFVSFYGANKSVHDKIAGVPESGDKVERTLESCRLLGLKVVLNCVILSDNLNEMVNIYKYANEKGLKIRTDCDIVPRWDGSDEFLEKIINNESYKKMLGQLAWFGHVKTDDSLHHSHNLGGCYAALNSCYISPQGELWPCIDVPWKCGELQSGLKFAQIWQDSPILNKARRLQKLMAMENNKLCIYSRHKKHHYEQEEE